MVNEARRSLVKVGGLGLVALFVVAGCDGLIGLGPSATLVDASLEGGADDATSQDGDASHEAGPDAAVAEAGAPEAGYVCGLPPQGSAACDTCDNANCCDLSIACSKDPRCAEGVVKLENCIYDAVCVDQVDNEYADTGVMDLQNCTVSSCITPCFPGSLCLQLAACCRQVPSNVPSLLQACISQVDKLDEASCQSFLTNFLRGQLGPQFCGGSAPTDAGMDAGTD